jgi:hypothetical protein
VGVERLVHLHCYTLHPPPHPSPTRGEGADRVCGSCCFNFTGTALAFSDHVTSAPPWPSRFFTPGHNTSTRQIAKIAADKGRRMKTE